MNKKNAFFWYTKSAERDYAQAQYNLAVMYLNEEATIEDKKQAEYWMRRSLSNGNEAAREVLVKIKFSKL